MVTFVTVTNFTTSSTFAKYGSVLQVGNLVHRFNSQSKDQYDISPRNICIVFSVLLGGFSSNSKQFQSLGNLKPLSGGVKGTDQGEGVSAVLQNVSE